MNSSVAERNEIVLKMLPRVKKLARHITSNVTPNIRREDLVSAGVIGLIQAIDTYSPDSGVRLSTYATYRIRGAMLDSIRKEDSVPQSQRRLIKQIASATAKAKAVLGRRPEDFEIASMMCLDVADFCKLRAEITSLPIIEQIGIEARSAFGPDTNRPDVAFEVEEMKKRLNEAMCHLPEEMEKVLTMFYWMGMPPREIALVINSDTRKVWHIRKVALIRLRRLCSEMAQ